MDVLKEKNRYHTLQTLACIRSAVEQLSYKKNVPFVHIGYELMAQSDTIDKNLSLDWYRAIWTPKQLAALEDFRARYLVTSELVVHDLPDIPGLLEDTRWINFMHAANEALTLIGENE